MSSRSRRTAADRRPLILRSGPLGGVALALVGGGLLYRTLRQRREAGEGGAHEATRVLTLLRSPDEVYRAWHDPTFLTRSLALFADVTPAGSGRLRWALRLPSSRPLSWETESVEERPGELSSWRSRPGAALASSGELRLRPAPAGRGTEATLSLQFGPQTPALGGAALGLAVEAVLRRFKSLAETGEIATLEHNPAARPS